MAMNEAALSQAIQAELSAAGFSLGNSPDSVKFCDAIAKAVVTHIVADASVDGGVCAPGGPVAGAKIT